MSATAENLPAIADKAPPHQVLQTFSSRESDFMLRQREAKALASSDLVPQAYRNNLPNVMLALDIAERVGGAGVFAVMQNLHIIQGRPSWSSSFLIATVNHCGRFAPLRFEVKGEDASDKGYKVRAFAKDIASGEVCYGTWITWKMVDAEGWSKKSGSKWLTMPEQMFLYRAAAFWARIYAPEVSIGLHTVEENQDRFGNVQVFDQATNTAEAVADLKQVLLGKDPAPADEAQPEPERDPDTGEVIPEGI